MKPVELNFGLECTQKSRQLYFLSFYSKLGICINSVLLEHAEKANNFDTPLSMSWGDKDKGLRRDIRLAVRRNLDMEKLKAVIRENLGQEKLDDIHRNHVLVVNYAGRYECHI